MPPRFLPVSERQRVAAIVGGLRDFVDYDIRGRRVLLQNANLHFLLEGGFQLGGEAGFVAQDLVGFLEGYGPLEDRPTYHALGALLAYVVENLKYVPADDRRFLASVIVRYALVGDADYLGRLREQYGITETPARSPGAAGPPAAAPRPVPVQEPAFEVALGDEKGLEQVINNEDNFLDMYALAAALYHAQAVCLIEVPKGNPMGTGFLIGPDLLLTNQHVLKSKEYLELAVARFNYRIDALGVRVEQKERHVHTSKDLYVASGEQELDYALVRLEEPPLKDLAGAGPFQGESPLELLRQGKHRGYLSPVPRLIVARERVNIIQHPQKLPLKVVLTQNYVAADMTPTRVHYVADTMDGSSGSPVFSQTWELVALHHSGKPWPPPSLTEKAKKLWKGKWRVNEGIPMQAILNDLKQKGKYNLLPAE